MFPKVTIPKQTIYLDHAATTPLDPTVRRVMEPFLGPIFGNPSALYRRGLEAARAIKEARASVAGALNARPAEIIFTAGGTESINLAIFGAAREYELAHKKKGHLITSAIEHHAVLHCLEALKQEGWKISILPVDAKGFINLKDLKNTLRPDTILVSVMYANNEIGTIEPIREIGKFLRGRKILFHTDACQATGFLDMDMQKLGVDLLSANGSKIYGPKQMGFLFVRTGIKLRPLVFGGGQERGLRSGTENVPGIVGLAKALELAQKNRVKENERLTQLRDYFTAQILKNIPRAKLNGPADRQGTQRLANNISITFDGVEGESLLLYLDSYNIAIGTGSACTSHSPDASHVLRAIGLTERQARSTVRFTLGKATTKKDLDYVMSILAGVVSTLRKTS